MVSKKKSVELSKLKACEKDDSQIVTNNYCNFKPQEDKKSLT